MLKNRMIPTKKKPAVFFHAGLKSRKELSKHGPPMSSFTIKVISLPTIGHCGPLRRRTLGGEGEKAAKAGHRGNKKGITVIATILLDLAPARSTMMLYRLCIAYRDLLAHTRLETDHTDQRENEKMLLLLLFHVLYCGFLQLILILVSGQNFT